MTSWLTTLSCSNVGVAISQSIVIGSEKKKTVGNQENKMKRIDLKAGPHSFGLGFSLFPKTVVGVFFERNSPGKLVR